MTLKLLHVLDHSIPLHSGYTFRTLNLLREQRKLGWQTVHVTSPKHEASSKAPFQPEQTVDGWHFHRSAPAPAGLLDKLPAIGGVAQMLALMKQLKHRLLEVARREKPDFLHAHARGGVVRRGCTVWGQGLRQSQAEWGWCPFDPHPPTGLSLSKLRAPAHPIRAELTHPVRAELTHPVRAELIGAPP